MLVLVGVAVPAAARERIDLIRLTNGDRVTGEIIRLQSGVLDVQTYALGIVAIDWPDVEALISSQLFELQLADGRRLFGRLDETEEGGFLEVETVDEHDWHLFRKKGGAGAGSELELPAIDAPNLRVPLNEVVGIIQRGATVWRSLRGHLDLGFNFSSADNDTQFSLEAEFGLQGPRVRWTSQVSSVLSDSSSNEQRQRNALLTAFEIPVGRHWVLEALGSWESNDDLNLESRFSVAGVATWIAARSVHGRWGLGAGIAETDERYLGSDSSIANTLGVLRLSGEYYRFGAFGTTVSGQVVYLPLLTGPTRHRIEIRSSLRQKLYRDFAFSISPYYSFDSRPPAGVKQRESWGWVSGIGWTF